MYSSSSDTDLSLFTTSSSSSSGNKKRRAKASTPKGRPKSSARAAAPIPKFTEERVTAPKKEFRWRTSSDIVPDSLSGIGFTISGRFNSIYHEDMVDMIESCGGRVYKTLAKKSQYLIAGDKASNAMKRNADDAGKQVLDEEEFFELVRAKGRQYKFHSYREPKERYDEEEEDEDDEEEEDYDDYDEEEDDYYDDDEDDDLLKSLHNMSTKIKRA